jgi:hypothetical protein
VGILAKTSERAHMSPARVAVAIGLCGLVGLAQLLQTLLERDDWPLSSYPMYSWRQPSVATKFDIFALTADGEVKLSSQHTKPLTGSRLRRLLGANAKTTAATLVPVVCKNLAKLNGPAPSALRVYKKDWRINSQLKDFDTPGRLHTIVPVLCPEQAEVIRAQKEHPAPGIAAPPGSVILEAEDLQLNGGAQVIADTQAHHGKAVSLNGPPSESNPEAASSASVTAKFNAEAGKYHVWLRSKAVKGKKDHSVWLQLNNDVDTDVGISLSDLANPTPNYPIDAYAWTSKKSGREPVVVQFDTSGSQTLVISNRRGTPIIDQVLLTPGWAHHPVHNSPLRP